MPTNTQANSVGRAPAKEWEALAIEAIADAGHWKNETRSAQSERDAALARERVLRDALAEIIDITRGGPEATDGTRIVLIRRAALAALAFFASRPGWQPFDTDNLPLCEAIADLVNLGFLERGKAYGIARFTGKIRAS